MNAVADDDEGFQRGCTTLVTYPNVSDVLV
jgi:hypothetical protein